MFKQLKLVAVFTITAILIACGGGGDSGGDSGVATNNPLKKYEGTYFVCDGRLKDIIDLVATGSDSLNARLSTEVYSGENCSGEIVGLYRWNAPASVSYQDKSSATVPFPPFPHSDTVDRVQFSVDASTATFTGTGVKDNCVKYSYGEYVNGAQTGSYSACFDLELKARTTSGALYLTSDTKYLVTPSLKGGAQTTDQIYSKIPEFNVASLGAITLQSAEGLWYGTATPGGVVRMLVQPSGEFYQFYGDTTPDGNIHGTLSINAYNRLSLDTSSGQILGVVEKNKAAYASTVLSEKTLNFDAIGGPGVNRVVVQDYNPDYNKPFTLADLAGNYSTTKNGEAYMFSIDASGFVSGATDLVSDSACQLKIIPDEIKRFAIINISGCKQEARNGVGVGVALLEGSGIGQKVFIGTTSGDGATIYGVKI